MSTPPGEDPTVKALDALDATTPAPARPSVAGGTKIGRYEIVRTLGRGGMGTVYAAYDPQLDRKVALKLLHPGGGSMPEALISEAKALARLDDQHVVQVFDAGEHGNDVFIAMQLVDGEDLSTALAKHPDPAQILRWFVDAGRGLAAAHAAGLVHRDFKPSNVLIDRRGRVAVTDFGLAVSTRDGTTPGGFAGTPIYMAPEQHALEPATEASDQFAFCVALWEALFGQHPYVRRDSARSLAEVGAAISSEPLLPAPRIGQVPRRIVDALQRGLAREPAARWPSMTALLAELAPAERRRTWPIVALGVAAAVAGGVGVWWYARSHEGPSCDVQAAHRASTVWSAQDRARIGLQFAKSGRSYAAAAATRASTELDRFATRWQELASAACDAGPAGSGAADLLVRRRACLDGDLDRMHAVIDVLQSASAEVVDHAADVAATLPDLASCADLAALGAGPGAPPPAIALQVAQLDADLERVGARQVTNATGTLEEARSLLARANQLGWPPAVARAHIAVGLALSLAYQPALDELVQGAELAIANHLDRDAVSAWESALEQAAFAGKEDLLATLAAAAHSTTARLHDPALTLGVDIAHARALIQTQHWTEGLAICRLAIATAEKLGNSLGAERARDCVFEGLLPSGNYDELRKVGDQRIAATIELWGPDAPTLISYLLVIADADAAHGDLAKARAEIDRASAVLAKAYPGAANLRTVEVLRVRGNVELAEGKAAQGLQTLRDALATARTLVPVPVVDIAQLQTSIAFALAQSNQSDAAMRAFEDAIATARAQGTESMSLAMLLLNYGQLTGETDFDAGLRAFAEAKQILDHHHDPRASYATAAMAAVEAAHKRWRDALVHAEDAVEFSKHDPGADPSNTAELKFIVAQGLVETRGDAKRAHAIAREARATYATLGPGAVAQVAAIDRWLRAHP